MERQWRSCRTAPGCTLNTFAGFNGFISRKVLGEIRFRADFHQGDNVTTIWLAHCDKSLLSDGEMRTLPAYLANQEKLMAKMSSNVSMGSKLTEKFDRNLDRSEATMSQIEAKTMALREVIAPLNGLFPEVQFAETKLACSRRAG